MNTPVIFEKIGKVVVKNAPTIATCVGITGFVATIGLSIKETPKAVKALENLKTEKPDAKITDEVKVLAPIYWPMVTTGVVSIGCVIFANHVSLKRYAALVAAYQMSENALADVKDKMFKTIGEKKSNEVFDNVSKEKVKENPVSTNQVIITGNGTQLCYDAISGRYFESSAEKIRQAQNVINHRLIQENVIALNEFYYELGLEGIKLGDDLGWNMQNMDDILEIRFTSTLTDDDRPCLVLDYSISPTYWFAD